MWCAVGDARLESGAQRLGWGFEDRTGATMTMFGAGHFVVDADVPNGCDTAEDADYLVLESNRFRMPYVAVKVRPSRELNLGEEQVGFQFSKRLVDLQDEVAALDPGDPAQASKLRELRRGESFLEYLIELQTAYGISNFF